MCLLIFFLELMIRIILVVDELREYAPSKFFLVQFGSVNASGKIMPKWPSPRGNNKMDTFDKLYFLVPYCIISLIFSSQLYGFIK